MTSEFPEGRIHKKYVEFSDHTRLRYISYFKIVRSNDGINFNLKHRTKIYPKQSFEKFGMEDARITKLGDKYFISYVVPDREKGVSTCIITTQDFKIFRRFPEGDTPDINFEFEKDIVIFPKDVESTFEKDKIGRPKRRYAAFVRPHAYDTVGCPGIWIKYSRFNQREKWAMTLPFTSKAIGIS